MTCSAENILQIIGGWGELLYIFIIKVTKEQVGEIVNSLSQLLLQWFLIFQSDVIVLTYNSKEIWNTEVKEHGQLTSVCQLQRWLGAPVAARQRRVSLVVHSGIWTNCRSPHAPVWSLWAASARWPEAAQKQTDLSKRILQTHLLLCCSISYMLVLTKAVLTSFPAPGRKVLTLIIFPGAGNGDSIKLLMKG